MVRLPRLRSGCRKAPGVSATATPGTSWGAMYAEYQVPEAVPDVPSGPDVPEIPADPTPPGGDPEPMDIAA